MSQCVNPDCLHKNPSNNNFCNKCGQKLLLRDRYRSLDYLGEGGFGRAFKAIDIDRHNSYCVIKQFLPAQQGSSALQKCIELFQQESKLLELLGKHPQIPDLLAFFDHEGKLYLIQEYIEGKTLFDELKEKGRLSEQKVRQFLLEMLPIYDFIHKKGVIHRDTKPENIIRRKHPLDPDIYGQNVSQLVLIDFGVSKQLSTTVMTKLGTGVGSPGYSSPEQMRGFVSASSDLYSLGVTAVRLLTGVTPEDHNGVLVDPIFDMMSMRWVWKEYLSKNGGSISADLDQVLAKMLEDIPNNRYQTAGEVLRALQSPTVQSSTPNPVLQTPQPSITVPSVPSVNYTPSQPQIPLKTSKADFTTLNNLLSQKKWKEADQETNQLVLKIANRKIEGYLDYDACKNFPSEELKIIDKLWDKHSNGHFSLSYQKQRFEYHGGTPGTGYTDENWNAYVKMSDDIGWRKNGNWVSYSDFTFSTNALQGHLPSLVWTEVGFGLGVVGWRRVRVKKYSFLSSKL